MESLVGRAQTIAKGWLLLLLERAPLDAVGTIPAAALAAEGPALCAALARGLGSDVELDRLRADGDLAPLVARVGPLCGAADAIETVGAVEALRACLWTTALESDADARDAAFVGRLADRLATVTAVVTATALTGHGVVVPASQVSAPSAPPRAAAAPEPPPAAAAGPVPAYDDVPPDHDGIPHAPYGEPPAQSASASGGGQPAWSHPEPALEDLRDDDPEPVGSVTQLPGRAGTDPRHGPVAGMDDSDLWIATLERHIDRCQREGGGLALLRVELVDGDRVAASAPDGESHVPYGRLAQAIRRAIRRQDLVASDHQGRAWVIAPGVGRAGAIALAERIGAGVEQGESWRGAPLAATIGFAVYGEDGHDAATLIDRAEEAMLAATAAGARIGEAAPHPEDFGAGPDLPGPRLVR
ncbi:diguanylate cyclase [Conexibacter stalactiti]|uniref:Diguanylate cyclase n=1 Tax=Conexibacter stalactiti TaxID=1940611 RepID=A0ABU4HXS7_9ACTN|nr:diguanylate cyclase [Conexibacter stalactiti]MDW5597275.1 diguanylate cyclase [Conexibacter stalactiti]MEC5037917.1 diguanylate cyclase [Conexibacter stalactiti]